MLRNRDGKHEQIVSSEHRTAFVLLLDMSGSMSEVIEYTECKTSKCSCVKDIAEQILQELYIRANVNGELCDCYDVAVISYSGRGVLTHLGGAESPFVPITELRGTLNDISVNGISRFDTPEDIAERYKNGVTLEPRGDSPMFEALLWLYELLDGWCSHPDNMDSRPPMVLHATDGQATDGAMDDIVDIARNIMSLGTNDGDVLLLNMQLGDQRHGSTIIFPTEQEAQEHSNSYFRKLSEASSKLPKHFAEMINSVREIPTSEQCIGIGYNASIADVVSMMTVGTESFTIK